MNDVAFVGCVLAGAGRRVGEEAAVIFNQSKQTNPVRWGRQVAVWVLIEAGWSFDKVGRLFSMSESALKKAKAAACRNFAIESLRACLDEAITSAGELQGDFRRVGGVESEVGA